MLTSQLLLQGVLFVWCGRNKAKQHGRGEETVLGQVQGALQPRSKWRRNVDRKEKKDSVENNIYIIHNIYLIKYSQAEQGIFTHPNIYFWTSFVNSFFYEQVLSASVVNQGPHCTGKKRSLDNHFFFFSNILPKHFYFSDLFFHQC